VAVTALVSSAPMIADATALRVLARLTLSTGSTATLSTTFDWVVKLMNTKSRGTCQGENGQRLDACPTI